MLSYLNPLPHLSKYKGPHKVGSVEFEIPVSELPTSGNAPDARVTTIKFRIFYPTSDSATSKKSIPWLPTPQKVWNQAYAQFMGISEHRASWLSKLPSVLSYVTIPAIQNAQLLKQPDSKPWPVVIFSHGLGGNYNTYSSLLGSLASCGIVCVAPEHRDGSAPTSLIKSSHDQVETTIPYRNIAHSPTVDVLNARNTQLRIRLWEMDLVHSAISQLNQGKQFTNFADTVTDSSQTPSLQNALDLAPSRITWAGHSFGSATTVQFVKSVYWQRDAPAIPINSSDSTGWNMTPIFTTSPTSELTKQITQESPVVLLDLWTMPLRGATASWLWEKPLPCYDRRLIASRPPNTISIMSAEFYKWPDLRNRTRAVLSDSPQDKINSFDQVAPGSNELKATNGISQTISRELSTYLPTSKHETPAPAEEDLNEPVEPELTPVPSHVSHTSENPPSPPSDLTPSAGTPTRASSPSPSLSLADTSVIAPAQLFMIPHSAHLSQSDFGPLFPNLTRYFMKAQDPETTMDLNVRAILSMMRGQGFEVGQLNTGANTVGEIDRILDESVVVERWQRVKL